MKGHPVDDIFRFPNAVRHDPAVRAWMNDHGDDLGDIAHHWLDQMRHCGKDVRELLHDGHPTACVDEAAFAYVNAFTRHVNVGFFKGAELADPMGILVGTGKAMRHVKVWPGGETDLVALAELIETAYRDMRRRIRTE